MVHTIYKNTVLLVEKYQSVDNAYEVEILL